MLALLWSTICSVYYHSLVGVYLATVTLVLFGRGWGQLPRRLLTVVNRVIQGRMVDDEPILIDKVSLLSAVTDVEGVTEGDRVFAATVALATNGISSIVRDDMLGGFTHAPNTPSILRSMSKSTLARLLHGLGLIFRVGFLFPLRIALMSTAMAFLVVTAVIILLVPGLSRKQRLYFGKTFARLFNTGTGLVVDFYGHDNRPKCSGFAVSNHLTANDVMTLYSDCDDIGYTVTGQAHGGFIHALEEFGGRLTPALWLDRACSNDRLLFQKKVLEYASSPTNYPILIFPEGFCSNNQFVLQFRKGVFGGDVPVYPLAIKQDARFGDSFWKEDTYMPYLLRCMLSWALTMQITYLPEMRRRADEPSDEFARRVQVAIGEFLKRPASVYDGGMKRPRDRASYKLKLEETLYREILGTYII